MTFIQSRAATEMFPRNFLWGVADAGYQVEAAPGNADWDVFVNTPAITARVKAFSDHPQVAADTIDYESPGAGIGHESLEIISSDLDRARALGLNAYRFS